MKIKWIKNLFLHSDHSCYKLANDLYNIDKVIEFGKSYSTKKIATIKNKFWIDVLKTFILFIDKLDINKWNQVLHMPLFYNENIKINSNPIFFQDLYNNGYRLVKDILNKNGSFKTLDDIKEESRNNIIFIHYYSIRNAVNSYLTNLNFVKTNKLLIKYHNPSINCYFFSILTSSNSNKLTYNTLTKNDDKPTCQNRWLSLYPNLDKDWKKIYSDVFVFTRDTYLQWLQVRIVHRILPTNILLQKMKIKNDKTCTFCKTNDETLLHLFYECVHVKPLLQYISNKLKTKYPNYDLNSEDLLLGLCKKEFSIDTLFLNVKRYVYNCKIKQYIPSIHGLTLSLRLAWNIHKNTNSQPSSHEIWADVGYVLQNQP